MARTKRKVKNRAKSHIKSFKAARRKRINAGGSFRTAESRSRRRAARRARPSR